MQGILVSPKMLTDHHIRTLTDALKHVLEDDAGGIDGVDRSSRGSMPREHSQPGHGSSCPHIAQAVVDLG